MKFCTEQETDSFLDTVPHFEQMLVDSDIHLFKFYLDISKSEQKKRLRARAEDPLKQWKISPIDAVATTQWEQYSTARNEMLARTHTLISPWSVVRADDKSTARINVIRSLLARMEYPNADRKLLTPNPNIVFAYDERYLDAGMIAP
jgi:polyphosphate kinase 2 (PPK2 family)